MTPTNRMTAAQAAKFRAAAGIEKPKKQRAEPLLIDEKYSSPEPGVHMVDVPCVLLSPNTREDWRVIARYKKSARNAVLGRLAHYLPKMALDAERRGSVKLVVLSRIGPKAIDDDNNQGALKCVRDTVCAWLVNGPVFDVARIGDYDAIVWSPVNPHGRLDLRYDQIIRSPKWRDGSHGREPGRYGVRIELQSR